MERLAPLEGVFKCFRFEKGLVLSLLTAKLDQSLAWQVLYSKMMNVLRSLLHPTTIPASTVEPPLPFVVFLSVTIVFISIYAILFVFTMTQLLLILVYKHRRLSYQSIFLFTCLIWAGIRTTLFSFYFNDCKLVNNLQAFPRWFLFAFPIYLQFLMLGLLTLYMVKVCKLNLTYISGLHFASILISFSLFTFTQAMLLLNMIYNLSKPDLMKPQGHQCCVFFFLKLFKIFAK